MRISFVGYRDFDTNDKGLTFDHFDILPFTENLDTVRRFVSKVKAYTGKNGDPPEDLLGGLD